MELEFLPFIFSPSPSYLTFPEIFFLSMTVTPKLFSPRLLVTFFNSCLLLQPCLMTSFLPSMCFRHTFSFAKTLSLSGQLTCPPFTLLGMLTPPISGNYIYPSSLHLNITFLRSLPRSFSPPRLNWSHLFLLSLYLFFSLAELFTLRIMCSFELGLPFSLYFCFLYLSWLLL